MASTDAPTEAQFTYLYKLAGERVAERYGTCGEERIESVGAIVENREGTMTRGDISKWIDWFKKQPFDTVEQPARRRPADTFDAQSLEIGVYEQPNGDLYVVKPNRAGTRKYAAKVVPVTSGRITEGDTVVKVEYLYEKGAIFSLRPEMRISAERAEELSIKYRHCICCGHGIKVEDSVLRGVGPVCLKKYFSVEEQERMKARVREAKIQARDREPVGASA